jgi:hypothetical protein
VDLCAKVLATEIETHTQHYIKALASVEIEYLKSNSSRSVVLHFNPESRDLQQDVIHRVRKVCQERELQVKTSCTP